MAELALPNVIGVFICENWVEIQQPKKMLEEASWIKESKSQS